MRDRGTRAWVPLVTLFFARAVYAFNWYDIGAVLPLVQRSLRTTTADLGIILAAFLVGAGLFQLPAGFAARRWGNRTVSIGALVAMAVFALASGAAPNWIVLAGLRFGAGAGAAFFFAPALSLATSYFPPGSRGPAIGIYNAGFSAGSGVSLVAGAVLGLAFGWGWALAVGGMLLILGALASILVLPPPAARPARPRVTPGARSVLASRGIWALALGTSGLWAAYYVAAQYFVEFGSATRFAGGIALASLVPTVMILAEVVGGPVGGWFAERRGAHRRTLVAWGIASGVGVALVPFLGFREVWPMFVFLGFADGVMFAVLYLIPTYFDDLRERDYALGLGLLNAVQIFVGSGIAYLFALTAGAVGFSVAWIVAGASAVVFLPLMRWVPDTGRIARHGGRPGHDAPPKSSSPGSQSL